MADDNKRIKSHRDLVAWQKGMDMVVMIYRATEAFPKHELYGLTSQIRRADVSAPANIAEGQGRRLTGEFIQFLGNARGSLLELDTHLELALRLGYLKAEQHTSLQNQVYDVCRLVNGGVRSLTSNI